MSVLRCRWVLFLMLYAGLVATATANGSQRIENKEFKFTLRVPVGAVICTEASDGHRHGFSILLQPNPQGCKSSIPQPYVGIYGDYNVLNFGTPEQWLHILCQQNQPSLESKDLTSLTFPQHTSASCKRRGKDSWIDVFVTAQAGRWPGNGSSSRTPYINYTAQLHTNSARFGEDMKKFREILAGVNIF